MVIEIDTGIDALIDAIIATDPPQRVTYMDGVMRRAKEKRQRIIEREGDANGERLKPYYLQALMEEIIQSDMAEGRYHG